MAGSIKEFWEKIKARGGGILSDRELFSAVLIIVVGVASFGLGRLSVEERVDNMSQGATPAFTRTMPLNSPGASQNTSSQAVREETASSTEKGYVASKNSTKYHLPWCSGAARIAEENKVWFATKEEAEAAGYTPAANCKGI